jgi:leucyl-tRNA synthetase
LIEKEKNYPVSFNGKLKFHILLSNDLSKIEVEKIVSNHDLTIKNLDGRRIKKIIFVPNKIINVVC